MVIHRTIVTERPKNKEGNALKHAFVLQEVSKKFSDRVLFDNVTLSFFDGAKIGILGMNGAGKSTLLKIIAGVEKDFNGTAQPAPGFRVGYLAQEPILDHTKTVQETIMEGVAHKNLLLTQYNELCEKFAEPDADCEALMKQQAIIQTAIDSLDLWNLQYKITAAMEALRCPPPDQLCYNLSGGERRRVALCRLLLSEPDILLLDEPTNHLDAESVAWIERFLKDYKGLVIAITHDRYFLDNVAGYILEIDAGRLIPFKGNYGEWLSQKQERLNSEKKQEKNLERILAQELEWIKKCSRGQQAKSKARVAAFEKKTEEKTTTALSRRIESGSLVIPEGPRLGDNVVTVNNLSVAFDDRIIFENISFQIRPGKALGIIGPNGSGKTTLLKCITSCQSPTSGSVSLGKSVCIGYNAQTREALDNTKTVWEEICGGREYIEVAKGTSVLARNYVAQFNFRGTDQQKRIGQLSGGERNRVSLAKSLAQGCNLIILDEPTNDLDVNTLRNLEEALVEFGGAAIVVTHDRWFLDRLADELLIFQEDGTAVHFQGNWSQWEAAQTRHGTRSSPKSRKFKKIRC
eukprot:TRINITY_DN4128_c0_g1_i6.p1 TRINITY_DN4128_c0_g1~~TRINITY_DN4128_c0_g1_i6.p1  ORF type:complete len:576 (-),score=68.29 TRINITY_DN4128_c0_g1_i6:164-1891(-)